MDPLCLMIILLCAWPRSCIPCTRALISHPPNWKPLEKLCMKIKLEPGLSKEGESWNSRWGCIRKGGWKGEVCHHIAATVTTKVKGRGGRHAVTGVRTASNRGGGCRKGKATASDGGVRLSGKWQEHPAQPHPVSPTGPPGVTPPLFPCSPAYACLHPEGYEETILSLYGPT